MIRRRRVWGSREVWKPWDLGRQLMRLRKCSFLNQNVPGSKEVPMETRSLSPDQSPSGISCSTQRQCGILPKPGTLVT